MTTTCIWGVFCTAHARRNIFCSWDPNSRCLLLHALPAPASPRETRAGLGHLQPCPLMREGHKRTQSSRAAMRLVRHTAKWLLIFARREHVWRAPFDYMIVLEMPIKFAKWRSVANCIFGLQVQSGTTFGRRCRNYGGNVHSHSHSHLVTKNSSIW